MNDANTEMDLIKIQTHCRRAMFLEVIDVLKPISRYAASVEPKKCEAWLSTLEGMIDQLKLNVQDRVRSFENALAEVLQQVYGRDESMIMKAFIDAESAALRAYCDDFIHGYAFRPLMEAISSKTLGDMSRTWPHWYAFSKAITGGFLSTTYHSTHEPSMVSRIKSLMRFISRVNYPDASADTLVTYRDNLASMLYYLYPAGTLLTAFRGEKTLASYAQMVLSTHAEENTQVKPISNAMTLIQELRDEVNRLKERVALLER